MENDNLFKDIVTMVDKDLINYSPINNVKESVMSLNNNFGFDKNGLMIFGKKISIFYLIVIVVILLGVAYFVYNFFTQKTDIVSVKKFEGDNNTTAEMSNFGKEDESESKSSKKSSTVKTDE